MARVSMVVDRDVETPMRDGVLLRSDVYRPAEGGPFPVLLMRTPYDRSMPMAVGAMPDPLSASARGYAMVMQDVRGRYASDGQFVPFVHEAQDGHDTVEWIAAQSWCDGNVGMFGASYVGYTQWMAASQEPPHLRAISPVVATSDLYDHWVYEGGAQQLWFDVSWLTASLGPDLVAHRSPGDVARAERIVDAIDHLGDQVPLAQGVMPSHFDETGIADIYRAWIDHHTRDGYWTALSPREAHARIRVPVLDTAGWFDVFLGGSLQSHQGVRDGGGSEAARNGSRLIVGPWRHAQPLLADPAGDRVFGLGAEAAGLGLPEIQYRFFDRWLRGIEPAAADDPKVRLFVMGEGVWRTEETWPLPRAVSRELHLRSAGGASTRSGDGRLAWDAPVADEPADSFRADPSDPVPTRGGNLCCWQVVQEPGAFDQGDVEDRPDVLVYTSERLAEAVEVTGPVRLRLFVSSEAPDLDVTARLLDVDLDDDAWNLTEGIRRVRTRDGAAGALLEPGQVVEVEVDLLATSNLFRAGHRIRLEVAASNWPRFDANPQDGSPFGQGTPRVATHTIHHDALHPSRLVLPVVPRG